jgi:single-strand DNA-binding protein
MTLAVDRSRPNSRGEKEADFFDIVAWRKLAETCANYLKKGRLVSVDGRLRSRKWEKDGIKHKAVEVLAEEISFLDRAKPDEQVRHVADGEPPLDDEVPF